MLTLVTGANGFLGYYLVEQLLTAGHQVIATSRGKNRLPFNDHPNFLYNEMDITDPFSVHDVFEKHKPDIVIHAGAQSKVDEAEKDQWETYRINVEGTVSLLINAAAHQSFVVFVSTDFIFDGIQGMYREDDKPNPINFYGKTKWEAEQAVTEYEYDWAIVRTILVYGKPQAGKENILTVVRNKLSKGEEYRVVNDQFRTPTYVEDLAKGIVTIVTKRKLGIYNVGGAELMTPYQMAMAVADYFGLDSNLLKAVTEKDFSQPGRRPLKTGLNIDKARKELEYEPLPFAEGIRKTFS
jgi:dTDP-4-dehydrorhamnose reductase